MKKVRKYISKNAVGSLGYLLRCPNCGGTHIHHDQGGAVIVYHRPSVDEKLCLRATIDEVGIAVSEYPSDSSPSRRRGAVDIIFECETCKYITTFRTVQHKGSSYLQLLSQKKHLDPRFEEEEEDDIDEDDCDDTEDDECTCGEYEDEDEDEDEDDCEDVEDEDEDDCDKNFTTKFIFNGKEITLEGTYVEVGGTGEKITRTKHFATEVDGLFGNRLFGGDSNRNRLCYITTSNAAYGAVDSFIIEFQGTPPQGRIYVSGIHSGWSGVLIMVNHGILKEGSHKHRTMVYLIQEFLKDLGINL